MFQDRNEGGKKLAKAIKSKIPDFQSQNSIILALPRGGVVVGKEIAQELKIPLDIIVTRKIGAPGNPEYAIAAVSEHQLIRNPAEPEIPNLYIQQEAKKEREEIKRRMKTYRGNQEPPTIKGKNVFLVDDGIATGLTMLVAIREIKSQNPLKIILAVPVAPPESIENLKKEVDQLICLETPPLFFAVGQFYTQFEQITDEQVVDLLRQEWNKN